MEDLAIALNADIKPIKDIAKKLGLKETYLELYGQYKAKINYKYKENENNNLILVTGISPTRFGEGKSTVTIGLADALSRLGKKTCIALREPSLGPVMGLKGGACGGGYSQVIPMEDINIHFTGDFHALTAANNLISALIDNHLYYGNQLQIDPQKIMFKRVLDVNDRALRKIIIGSGNGVVREEGFDITVASELMAIMCLSKDDNDFKERVANILIAYNYANEPIFLRSLNCVDAIYLLMKDALKPNLVQTLEGTPTIIHGGPFANIAHGCNSIIATKTAISLSDYTITEAGFGSDLGMEKFLDIKTRVGDLRPALVVVVATLRALKYNGGAEKPEEASLEYLKKGIVNLIQHVLNVKKFNLVPVVALNKFSFDTTEELNFVISELKKIDVEARIVTSHKDGSRGALDLANLCLEKIVKREINYTYQLSDSLDTKISNIVTQIYNAKDYVIEHKAANRLAKLTKKIDLSDYYICIAKTQYSFSHDKTLLGAPSGYTFLINDFAINSGAKFLILIAGDIIRMPGLPKKPAATQIVYNDTEFSGLF